MNEAKIRHVLDYLGIYDAGSSYRQGNYLIHPCPFAPVTHKNGTDRHPSFGIAIVPDNYSYYSCFTCKQKGRLVDLPTQLVGVLEDRMGGNPLAVIYLEQIERESLKDLGLQAPVIIDQVHNKPEPLNKAIYENIYDPVYLHPAGLSYLADRGIHDDLVISDMGLLFDEEEQRIIFPVYGMDGELYGFTGRTILTDWEKYHDPPRRIYPRIKDYGGFKKKHFLLGEHRVEPGKPIVVVEGLFGYANLLNLGLRRICNPVALLGSAVTPEKADKLIKMNSAVYLMLDNDPAGEIGIFGTPPNTKGTRVKGAVDYLYGYVPIFIPEWPEGKTDPDELTYEDVANFLNITYPYIKPKMASNKPEWISDGAKALKKGKVI